MLERLGFPDGRWRRPASWTAGLILLGLDLALAMPDMDYAGRVLLLLGFANVARYTDRSWRRHRVEPVVPLGRVEWPRPKQP